MRRFFLFLFLAICLLIPSCDVEMISAENENINAFIFPYLEFELSDDCTYYIATVVAGAPLEVVVIPGEHHTEYGVSMPVEEFGGFENEEDAAFLKELYLAGNVDKFSENALQNAINIEKIEHIDAGEEAKWANLPKIEMEGYHFGGWKTGDEFIWEVTPEGEYVQRLFIVEEGSKEAKPVYYKLKKQERVEPTCTEAGNIEYYYCEHCSKKYSDEKGTGLIENVIIPATGHNLEEYGYIAPDCKNEGRKAHSKCTLCGVMFDEKNNIIEDVAIPKTDKHVQGSKYSYNEEYHWYCCEVCNTEMTETKEPHKEGDVCETCGYSYISGDYVCQHKRVLVPYKAPDCEEKGTLEHYFCDECNLKFMSAEGGPLIADVEIEPLGHDWENAWTYEDQGHYHKCKRLDCDAKSEIIEHNYNIEEEKFMLSPASCTYGAVYYKTCECGKGSNDIDYTFETEPLGHNYTKEDGSDNYKHNNSEHWIECTRRCPVEKEGSRAEHDFENVEDSAYIICTKCKYEKRVPQGGINHYIKDAYPKGSMVQESKKGTTFKFKVKNENEYYRITSYKWETSGVAKSADNADTFEFDAPNLKTYWVRCTFSNENGSASLSATVSGGN